MQNFISNAIKYTPQGRVLIGARRQSDGRVRIEVWDTGLGIPDESRADVFREFARLEPAQRTAPGLGLGLSIVERLARVLEADLGLRSRVGSGSVFFVDIPLSAATWSEPDPVASEIAPAPSSLAGLTICAIDNEPRILDGMRILLEGWGCTVVTAGSRAEAIEALDDAALRARTAPSRDRRVIAVWRRSTGTRRSKVADPAPVRRSTDELAT